MFVFSTSNLCMIFACSQLFCKFLCSNASIPPPKRSGDHRLAEFTNFAQRLEYELLEVPAKGTQTESLPAKEMTVFRLPTHIRPRSYALKMVIDNEKSEFFGEVKINASVSENCDTVLLHSHLLKISQVVLYHRNDEIPTWFTLDPANQLLRIQTNTTLLKNEVYEIKVKFAGRLNTKFMGIYRSISLVHMETKYVGITQFEPTQARQAFPCFDEPHFRATFDIRVARYQHEVALSNMPLISTSTPDPSIDDRVWNTFDTTPPMPTYLVVFVVAQSFAHISDPSGKYTLWATKNKISDYSYARSIIARVVQVTEDYTGIEYMLPQLKMVAVESFLRGAMENWGLMTFKADLVKFREYEDNSWTQRNVLVLVAHETIHQWFGNYVTIPWWDTVWLKEGIATLLSYTLGALVDSNWRLEDIFLYEVKSKAIENDGMTAKTPMTYPVNTPTEIDHQFNTVNYEKAASVLHMLRFMVSPDTFQKALQIYLRTGHTAGGGVTSADDLWAAFDKQLYLENRSLGNSLTVGQTMKSWTHQTGYPIIRVSRYNKGSRDDIGFKQEPFNPSNEAQEWVVPVSCTKGSNPDFDDTRPKLWLLGQKEVILSDEVGTDEWILCNVQQTGYYRLNYDEDNWRLIAQTLNSSPERIHRYNRHQIISDIFSLMHKQRVSYYTALKVISTLDHENDALMWKNIPMLVTTLLLRFEGTKAYERLQKFWEERFHNIYQRIGFYEKSTDALDAREIRSLILQIVCQLGNTDCLSKATVEFNKHETIDRVPSYMRYAAIVAALKFNSSSDLTWTKLRHYFESQKDPQNNLNLIKSFLSLKDESIIKKFLSDLSANKTDELQKYFLQISLSQYHGVKAAMHFIQETLPKMGEYTAGETTINALLGSISVRSKEQMNLINEILETATKLNSNKYVQIIKMLYNKRHEAEVKVKALDELSTKMLAALDLISQDPVLADINLSHGLPQLSAAESSFSNLISCLILTCISWFLSATI